jgi:hypothetical protein
MGRSQLQQWRCQQQQPDEKRRAPSATRLHRRRRIMGAAPRLQGMPGAQAEHHRPWDANGTVAAERRGARSIAVCRNAAGSRPIRHREYALPAQRGNSDCSLSGENHVSRCQTFLPKRARAKRRVRRTTPIASSAPSLQACFCKSGAKGQFPVQVRLSRPPTFLCCALHTDCIQRDRWLDFPG